MSPATLLLLNFCCLVADPELGFGRCIGALLYVLFFIRQKLPVC